MQKMKWLAAAVLSAAACNAVGGEFVESRHAQVVEGSYIVAFEDQDVRITEMVAQRLVEQSRAEGFAVDQVWKDAVHGVALSGLDDEAARRIARTPGVKFVKSDTYLIPDAVQYSPPSWGIDRVDQRSLPLSASYQYDYWGNGVNIYILDSLIEGTNPEFDSAFGMGGGTISRFSTAYDPGPPCPAMPVHGTNVAAIAAGRTYGVAKGALIKSVRISNCTAIPIESYVISGLNWVTANGVQPAVINMSFSWGPLDPATSLVDDALLAAYGAGYFLVKSAGNGGSDTCASHQPTPALVTAVYTVAGSNSSDVFWLGAFGSGSNYGACVDMIAPAHGVFTVSYASTSPVPMTGTSAATPHVAGAAALIYEQFPTYTPAQVAALLNARATTGVITSVPTGTVNRLLYTLP